MDVRSIVKELEAKRSDTVTQLTKIDEALRSLRSLNGLLDEPVKAVVTRRGANSVRMSLEIPDIRDFAIEMIRSLGKEISCRELFDSYYKKIGKVNLPEKERKRLYALFYVTLAGKKGQRMGLVRKPYKIDGIGRETYFNVDSAMLLQTEKQIPGQTITTVK